MMKLRIFTIFIALFSVKANAQTWTAAQLELANTAKNNSLLTSSEKEAILYINLCRLYPKEFAEKEITNHTIDAAYGEKFITEFNKYKTSLLKDLSTRASSTALAFDTTLYYDAKCYANEISKADRANHERLNCKPVRFAECVSFGMATGKEIALQWLLDVNVTSLGHRKICLDHDYTKIGLSAASHFKWEYCAVAAFR